MVDISVYREIEKIKNENMMTSHKSLMEYIAGVKHRVSVLTGIPAEQISDSEVLFILKNLE